MPTKPVPLREALREAVENLCEKYEEPEEGKRYVMPRHVRIIWAQDEVDTLIEQIPIDLEANDAE